MADLPQSSSSAPPAVRSRKRKRRDAPETEEDGAAGKDEEESDSSFPGAAAAAGRGEQSVAPPRYPIQVAGASNPNLRGGVGKEAGWELVARDLGEGAPGGAAQEQRSAG